ncbi:MAG: hypothetical protein MUE56_05825, partial [Ignavibacteria bacterium]|nr:hypothetical protein [Ignavibacteria bacterium]
MKLDVIQSYSNRGNNDRSDERCFGGFYDSLIHYINAVRTSIDTTNTLKVFERAKIVRPAYGQRSTYQAEEINGTPFPRYYFENHLTGSNWTDTVGGVLVRKCEVGVHSQGYIVKDLIENCEQINRPNRTENRTWDIEYMISDYKDSLWTWYIKPRMRIDTSISNNINMQNIVVVNVVIKNFIGDSTLIPIRVSNFKNNGFYNGNYTEIYYINDQIFDITALASYLCSGANGNNSSNSKVDYRIYWPGSVSVCLDYVRVDDEWAHSLFNPNLDSLLTRPYYFSSRIQQEITAFGSKDLLSYFYMDECPINSFPCIAEVNKIIKRQTATRNKGLFAIMMEETAMHDYGWLKNLPSIDEYTDYILEMDDSLMTDVFLYTCYPFHNGFKYPSNLTASGLPEGIEYTQASSPTDYNNSMMSNFQRNQYQNPANDFPNGQVVLSCNIMSEMLKKSRLAGRDISPAFFIQAHSFEYWMADNPEWYNLREPTNQEMMLQGNMALIYGAKQVYLFSYHTGERNKINNNPNIIYHDYGLLNDSAGTTLRTSNYFGQDKWQGAIDVSDNLQKIGDVLYPAGSNNSSHMLYSDSRSVNPITYPAGIGSGLPFKYLNDLRSLAPNIQGINSCADYNASDFFDCSYERYWELGFFDPPSGMTGEPAKYFIALNKRSTPEESPGTGIDARILMLKFEQNDLLVYRNWKLTNAVTNELIATFDKESADFVNAGLFMPAEAKLIKLSPVITSGGELVCDETINSDVTIGGMIDGNGHNFIINEGKTVTFKQDAGIEMNGGVFICGINSDNADAVTLKGEGNSNIWKGLILNNCDSVGIYNTNITNIKANDTAKAVLLTNCYKSEFRKNTITANNNSGGIQAVFNNVSDDPIILKIRECTFNMNSSGYSAINVISNASVTLPLNIEWCIFNAGNDTSNAVMLTEVTGGVIKNNSFSNFGKSVVLLFSTADLYGNLILGRNNSQGIQCLAGSNVSLSPVSGMYLGGYNYIRNYGSSASNIYSDNSMFYINNGQNDFDLDDTTDSKHLTGNINGIPLQYVNAMKNCFHKDSVSNITATSSVIWNSTSDPVDFVFTDYSCELTPPGDFFVFQYDNYNDTVYRTQGGEGSGMESKAIELKEEENGQVNEVVNKQENEDTDLIYSNNNENAVFAKMAVNLLTILNIEENNYKALRDSININLRKRNYPAVEQKTIQILTQYPDSTASTGMIPKLYIAVINLDTGSTKTTQLKSFLENL